LSTWSLIYEDFAPEQQGLRETLCTLGNGYFATRGAAEESAADDVHYPGTYLAGGYDRSETSIAGRNVENEDLVNWPNWLCLSFRLEGGTWFDLRAVELLSYRQELDLARGVLHREVRFRDEEGRETELSSRRLVHMGDCHIAAIEAIVTPENWEGRLEIRSALDGRVRNTGVERYRQLNSSHLEPLESVRLAEQAILLRVRTCQSEIEMAQAARTRVFDGERAVDAQRQLVCEPNFVAEDLSISVRRGAPLRVEKIVALYTSRDAAISRCQLATRDACLDAPGFERLQETHGAAWGRLWRRSDTLVEQGEERLQLLLRLHIFHLVQTASFHTTDLDAGVPARGLHGEAYRGHVFWDETFILPFLNLRIPEITRGLLMYRYRRLPTARRLAAKEGYRGAMYPWQSGSDGREESQLVHLNPLSGRWFPDHSHRQRHINATIVYNVWKYYEATEDREFLLSYGAEIILEIARFWASIASLNPQRGRYEIHGVMGPDEFHDAFPGTEEPGLRNNAYTNVMAAWCLHRALDVIDLLPEERRDELLTFLGLSQEERKTWEEIASKLYVSFHRDSIISQFEGYETLAELDWKAYREKYDDVRRLDRILEAEGDSVNRYKVSKQADVLMLFYLFSAEELQAIFARLGYDFDPAMIPKNVDYYLARTSHGSTLSTVLHAWVLSRSSRERSWEYFQQANEVDVADVPGGTTAEGIHLGAMASTLDIVQRCYTGVETREGVLWLNPRLPDPMQHLRVGLRYRGRWFQLDVRPDRMRVTYEHGSDQQAKVGFQDEVYVFRPGDAREFAL
jgi:alpha,alpha-trehalase